MSFLFDKLFQKQNPELAGQMAKRGLIFDRIRHRWVRKPENRANPQTAPTSIKPESWTSSGKDLMLDPITGKPSQISQDEKLNMWNKLKSGDTINLWYDSAIRRGDDWKEFKVTRKTKSKKYDVEKIHLQSVSNPRGVKHYLYNRNGQISHAIDDLASSLISMKVPSQTASIEEPKWKRGDKVQIPHKGKMTTGTIVRYDGGEYYKGEKVGSAFYVVDVGEYESVKVPATNVRG